MKNVLLFFSINLLIGFSVNAQTENIFQRLDIRNVTSSEVRNSLATVPSGQLLVLDETKGEQLFNVKGSFTMQIPLSKGSIEIELEPANILSPDFKVTTSNGSVAAVDLPHFYHGKIKGVPTSAVAIAITKDAIEGLITDDKINLTIGRLKNSKEKLHVVYNTADIPFTNPICSGTDEEQIKKSVNQGGGPQTNLTSDCKAIEVYFEADFKTYTDWGSNVQTVVNTITGIFNNVSLLYSNVGVNVVISELKVWDSQQPYSSNLNSFHSYLNDIGNDFSGDLAHLVSTSGNGGTAYISTGQSVFNGMTTRAVFSNCDKSFAKAFSGALTNNVVNIPTYSWNVMVIAHELGHNFGLPHTHSCTWSDGTNIGPIDNCWSTESGPCTPGPTPTNGGTVMSYCHQNASIGINLANGFGPLPSAKILAEVNAATCLSSSRIKQPAVASASQVICPGETVTITASGCSGVYNWYDVATGGTTLSTNSTYTTPALIENKSYYVSCTFDGCTSRRKKVEVLIINGGLVNSDRFYCSTTNSGTLSLVNYAGSIIRWESSSDNFSTATTIANTSTTLIYANVSTTTKYRAVMQQGACSRFSQPATVLINPTRLYVNKNATGANNGASWTEAFTDVQSALNLSCPSVTEIWVAKGIYKPAAANGDRNLSFIISNNLKIYGGFSGTEVLLTDRNYGLIHTTNKTTLSGDLNGDDGVNFANNTENSYSVVRMNNVSNTTRLDGFTISGGNNTVDLSAGGGISLQNSSPVIANCIINGNNTNYRGGGMANVFGQPTIENCSFYVNKATTHGGAFYNLSNSGTIQTINISNSIFVGNSVENSSGSILFNYAYGSSGTIQNVNLTNCSFAENISPNHGIYNLAEVAGSSVNTVLKNCAFFNNGGNKTLFNETSGGTSTTTANYCFFQSSVANFTGSNNIISDISPFVSATDLHLPCGSLAANSGTSSGITATDLDGNPRPYAGTSVDMGAYELQGGPAADPTTISVSSKEICLPTNVTLTANCSVGFPTWYAQATGGTALGTGASFLQSPSVNTTYYVECSNACATNNRLPTPEIVVANSAATLALTSDFNANSTQIANTTLSATNKVINPAKVVYKAGNSVTLNQGFEARNGSTFLAQIGGCQNVDIPGLVAYYPFNGNANDETGNGFNGTINGATLTTDKFGAAQKALNFDGSNDFVRIPNLYNAVSQPLVDVTYSLWFKPNQNYGATDFFSLIIRTTDGGFTDMIGKPNLSSVENNKFQFYMFDNVANVGILSKATTINFTVNQWVHVVATRANGIMKIYLNAVKEGETAYTNAQYFYPDLYLGGHATFNRWYFNGAMDDLRIYNRALSDAEIQVIYNAEKL